MLPPSFTGQGLAAATALLLCAAGADRGGHEFKEQALFEIGCSAHSKSTQSPCCCSRGAFARRTKGPEHLGSHRPTACDAVGLFGARAKAIGQNRDERQHNSWLPPAAPCSPVGLKIVGHHCAICPLLTTAAEAAREQIGRRQIDVPHQKTITPSGLTTCCVAIFTLFPAARSMPASPVRRASLAEHPQSTTAVCVPHRLIHENSKTRAQLGSSVGKFKTFKTPRDYCERFASVPSRL